MRGTLLRRTTMDGSLFGAAFGATFSASGVVSGLVVVFELLEDLFLVISAPGF